MMRIMNLAGFHMNLAGFHPLISGGEVTEYIFASILLHRSIAVEAVLFKSSGAVQLYSAKLTVHDGVARGCKGWGAEANRSTRRWRRKRVYRYQGT